MMRSQHHLRFTRGNMITSSERLCKVSNEKKNFVLEFLYLLGYTDENQGILRNIPYICIFNNLCISKEEKI